ncbi:MAG: flagellar motor protein MotB [Phycisphaerae bacterium]|nr:flagellar motor protein MotB [Phycisphaerae bacterium]
MPRDKKERKEDGPPSQAWIVTFSDCMTLLLCFFVLLMTFSSFEEAKFSQLAGAFQSKSYDALEHNPRMQKNSYFDRPYRANEVEEGSAVPTDRPKHDNPPRPPLEMLDVDMDKDCTIFYLPSGEVFYARGHVLTHSAREFCDVLAEFLREKPCRVVIGETSNREAESFRRSWAIMRYLITQKRIASRRFSINAEAIASPERFGDKAVVAVSLVNVKIEE